MSWLWALFTFLNLWWIAVFIVIAIQGQRTDNFRKTLFYTSLLSAAMTAILAWLMNIGVIHF